MLLTNKITNTEVSTSDQTVAIGSATIIFYFLTLAYIYGSALYKNSNGKLELYTMSKSFEYSEKIGTTIGVVVFMALLQTLFSYQNIYSNDPKRSTIIAFNYLIILCWLLFMFIFPSTKVSVMNDGKNVFKEVASPQHSFLAFCVLASLIINCFLIVNLYNDYFDEKALESLMGIGYAIVAASILAIITMIVNAKNKGDAHLFVAFAELSCLILFGIYLIFFIQYPPVPSNQLSCVLLPK